MDLYRELLERKLTNSLRHFSMFWLGRAQNYAVSNKDEGFSLPALVTLYQNLELSGQHDLAANVREIILDA